MTLCVLCAQATLGDQNLCVFHTHGDGTDWATWNRIMCDFLHRGIVPYAPPEGPDALDLPIETFDEELVS
jgi:hypothetical protein